MLNLRARRCPPEDLEMLETSPVVQENRPDGGDPGALRERVPSLGAGLVPSLGSGGLGSCAELRPAGGQGRGVALLLCLPAAFLPRSQFRVRSLIVRLFSV